MTGDVAMPEPAGRRPGMAHSAAWRGHATAFLLAALLYAILLVYASLIPFVLRPRSLETAWAEFLAIPFLELGPESRADWIANLVAYAPLAFLIAAAPGARAAAAVRSSALLAAIVLCLALAVVVEFAQIFFAPRTVSLNDLLAETIGTVAGALAGWAAAPRSATLLAALRRGGRPALRVLAGVYCLAYLALSLFPYDFVIAGHELQLRLAFVSDRLWSVPEAERSVFHALAVLGLSVVAMMPVGALVARTGRANGDGLGRALAAGLLLGLLIEGSQALLLSGVGDVISILARGLGAVLGAVALMILRRADLPRLRRRLRPLAPLAVPPYLVLLAAVNDLLAGGWLGAAQAASKLGDLSFMPFYYHYYTTEAVALASAASRFAMYLPVGALLWLWRRPGAPGGGPIAGGAATAALIAGLVSAVFEGARLFKPDLRPDPTNVLIAAAAAGITYAVLGFGWRWLTRPAAGGAATAGSSLRP